MAVVTRVAAVDCGTHTIRLLVADVATTAGGPRLVDLARRMEIVRLGQGVDRTGRLSPAAIERTRVVLARYAEQITELGAERVRMVATSASRDAENVDEFVDMVRRTLGVPPEVISGETEARLSFLGAVADLPERLPGPYLVVDIGGGSTEFVVGERIAGDTRVLGAVSVDIGCVRMTERYLRSDPPTADEVAEATDVTTRAVDGALSTVAARDARTFVGLAGSVTTVAGIALGLDSYRPELIHHAQVRYAEVAKVTDGLLAASRSARLRWPVVHTERADVIGAGALILRTIQQRAGFEQVVASEHDILDGIAWSLCGRPIAASACPSERGPLG